MKKENEDGVLVNKEYQSKVIKKINTELKKMNEEDLEEILDLLKFKRRDNRCLTFYAC